MELERSLVGFEDEDEFVTADPLVLLAGTLPLVVAGTLPLVVAGTLPLADPPGPLLPSTYNGPLAS
jgi:hypothetical protein